jgi:hypothetical protein
MIIKILIHLGIFAGIISGLYFIIKKKKLPHDPDDPFLGKLSEKEEIFGNSIIFGAGLWIMFEIIYWTIFS